MASTTATAPTPPTTTAMATAAINVESPLSRLPAELLRLVLSHLGPKPLLRFGASCRAGAKAAAANALWVELVRLAWQEEDPMTLPGSSAREFFRQMRQPPAIMTRGPKVPAECEFALALSDLLHRPLVWQEYSGSTLGEYRLLIEVTDRDGSSVLTRSLQPFEGMFACRADSWLSAGERASAVHTGVPGFGWKSIDLAGPGSPGDVLCRGDRLSARLCVEWGGGCVCLGAVPAVLHDHAWREDDATIADLKFTWRMPAVTVPDQILDYIHAGDSRSCDVMRLQCIESVLYVGFDPTGTALEESHSWTPTNFRLEAAPHFVHPRQGPSYHPLLPVSNQTVKEKCRTDMMALCFLYEAMRMRDRE